LAAPLEPASLPGESEIPAMDGIPAIRTNLPFPPARDTAGNAILSHGSAPESPLAPSHDPGGRKREASLTSLTRNPNGDTWVWKVAAVAITLAAASLATRRIMAGKEPGGTGALAGLLWAGQGQGGLLTLECLSGQGQT
jgi:hypothetical protein